MKKIIAITILTIVGCGSYTMQDKYPNFIVDRPTTNGLQPVFIFKKNTINNIPHRRACIEGEPFIFHANQDDFLPFGYQIDWSKCDHFGNQNVVDDQEYYSFTVFFEITTQRYFANYFGAIYPLIIID
jgi:hypothetical protein